MDATGSRRPWPSDETPIEDLDLWTRALNALRREGVRTVGGLKRKTDASGLRAWCPGRGSDRGAAPGASQPDLHRFTHGSAWFSDGKGYAFYTWDSGRLTLRARVVRNATLGSKTLTGSNARYGMLCDHLASRGMLRDNS